MTDYQMSRAGEWFVEPNHQDSALLLTRSQVSLSDTWVGPQALYVVGTGAELSAYASAGSARKAYRRAQALWTAAGAVFGLLATAGFFALYAAKPGNDPYSALCLTLPLLAFGCAIFARTLVRAKRPVVPGVRLVGVSLGDLSEVFAWISPEQAALVVRSAEEPLPVRKQIGALILEQVRTKLLEERRAEEAAAWTRVQEIASQG